MDNSLLAVLLISAVGMTLLFLFLAFFYGLLALLAAVFKDKPTTGTEPKAEEGMGDGKGPAVLEDAVLRAAAVAVALARAEAEETSRSSAQAASEEIADGPPVSAWWSLHHQRQITTNPATRRSQ